MYGMPTITRYHAGVWEVKKKQNTVNDYQKFTL